MTLGTTGHRRPTRRLCAAALVVVLVGALVGLPSSPVRAIGDDVTINIPTPGPLGAITIVGDSVLVGAAYEPSLPTLLARDGWGPIRFRASLGSRSGNYDSPTSNMSVANWIATWRQGGWDAPNVAVNLGNNDVGFCDTDVAACATTIRYLLDAIGPGHQVWWSKITRLFTIQNQADAYNRALDIVAAERSNLHIWDWPAALDASGIPTAWDHIHLPDAPAYNRRSVLMAQDITAQMARGARTGGDAPLPQASGSSGAYRPLPPARVLDTRTTGSRLAAGEVRRVDLGAARPVGATAVAVGLTAASPGADGFLTAFPCGADRPLSSSVNFLSGVARGALAVVPVAADGSLCVYSLVATDIIVDVQGAFTPTGTKLTPRPPERMYDTRASGRAQTLTIEAPAGATAVAVDIVATQPAVPGFVTAYPCGADVPTVSNVNFQAGETIAGAAFVPTSASGTICLFTSTPDVDVVVDLTGVFSDSGALRFVPATPTRQLDTRDGTGGWSPLLGAGQTFDMRVAPPEAAAVTGTLTIVAPFRPSFLTAFGCGTEPGTSNVNAVPGAVLANSVTVGTAANGRLCISGPWATGVVFDTTGWWAP